MRSGNPLDPWPEEILRKRIALVADLHLCPDSWACQNLMNEGVSAQKIKVVGNSLRDHFFDQLSSMRPFPAKKDQLLVTLHRRRPQRDRGVEQVFQILKDFGSLHPELKIKYINHPNGTLKNWEEANHPQFEALPPLKYTDLLQELLCSRGVVTDSGGLQEEARWAGLQVALVRGETEWKEGLVQERVFLTGNSGEHLLSTLKKMRAEKSGEIEIPEPYSPKIAQTIAKFLRNLS